MIKATCGLRLLKVLRGASRLFLFLPVFAALLSCATKSDVIQDKAEGVINIYPVTFDEAWDISRRVIRWEGAEAIDSHKSQGYMVTSRGPDGISMGAYMGVWVEKVDEASTKITVVTKRKLATTLGSPLTESSFHKRYDQAVKMYKSEKRLPKDAPAE